MRPVRLGHWAAVSFVAITLFASTVRALDADLPPGWTEATRRSDLIVFYRDDAQTHGREVLAYTEIDAPPEVVFRTVTDFDRWAEFMPYAKESKILKRFGSNEMITYQLVSPPFVSDRDYYLHVKLTYASPATNGAFKSEWSCLPDYQPERDGVVRMRVNSGSWTYAPIDGGRRTRLTYSLLSDAGGSIPKWLVNRSNLALIPDIFKALRQRLAGRRSG